MTASQLAQLVRGRKIGRDKWNGYCPAHSDRNRSLSIAEGKNGVLVKCMSQGCDTRAVLDALGLTWGDLFRDAPQKQDQAYQTDAMKLETLMRRHTMMGCLAALEPDKRLYWFGAMRRVADEMEPLYWRVLPDREHVDGLFRWECDDYRKRRADWLLIHGMGVG